MGELKYLNDEGLGNVAARIKQRLITYATMPATAENGSIALYTGATNDNYTNGRIYQMKRIITPEFFGWSIVGGGTVYTQLKVPAAGTAVYETTTGDSSGTVTSYDSATNSIVYNGSTYFRDMSSDVGEASSIDAWVDVSPTEDSWENLTGTTVNFNALVKPGKYYWCGTINPEFDTFTVTGLPEDIATTYDTATPPTSYSIWAFITVTKCQYTYNALNRAMIIQQMQTTHGGLTGNYHRRCYALGVDYDPSVDSWSPWVKDDNSRAVKNFGKKIAMCGGSVAAGSLAYLFPKIEDVLGTRRLYSFAVGGMGFIQGASNFKVQVDTLISQHPTDKFDVVFFWCSTNDFNNNVAYGGVNSPASEDSVAGAMEYCFSTLYVYNPALEIYLFTPIRYFGTSNDNGYNPYSAYSNNFLAYTTILKQKCAKYSIPVLDLWNVSGINQFNETTFLSDHLHPNAAGYKKLMYQQAAFLRDGGYGGLSPVLPHIDEYVFHPNIPARSTDASSPGTEQSDYVDINGVTGSGGYWCVRDGICIAEFTFYTQGIISAGSTPLFVKLPPLPGGLMCQCVAINRNYTGDTGAPHPCGYAYISNYTDAVTGKVYARLLGDGFTQNTQLGYRIQCTYPIDELLYDARAWENL